MDLHPTARTWALPPNGRAPLAAPLARTNLRALMARPGRFEHHLAVAARIGSAQLAIGTASEPVCFAHANVSDEYVVPLPTGDAALDASPFRVCLAAADTGLDAAHIAHRAGDIVLQPYGWLHWPDKLRAPFEPPVFAPGARRSVLSVAFCASRRTPPGDRPLFVGEGREADAKPYVDPAPPMLLAPLSSCRSGLVARIGDARWSVAEPPFAPERGGYVLVLEAREPAFACDLVYVPRGATYDGEGVVRALVFESTTFDADPPPALWSEVPAPPFAPFERGAPAALPFRKGALEVHEADEREVEIRLHGLTAQVPRYWLARMLFRLALHGYALGYVETYGGFAYDDRGGVYRLGLRGGKMMRLARGELASVVEALYRAVAPPGYTEELR